MHFASIFKLQWEELDMDAGIESYGAYIPIYRMSLDVLAQVWGGSGKKGEKRE